MSSLARRSLLLVLCLALAACGRPPERAGGAIAVDVIGAPLGWTDPGKGELPEPQRVLLASVAQGLVAFDQNGDIRPALAQRWAVSDDGLTYIFRVRPLLTPRGGRIGARLIAARLNAARQLDGRNPLRRLLGAIASVQAITEEVLEIDLSAPRPNLLQLLAQPDLAVVRTGAGAGPFASAPLGGGTYRLSYRTDALPADATAMPDPIDLSGVTAEAAIARFRTGKTRLVLGGGFEALPLLAESIDPATVRADPAPGLFGFAFDNAQGPLASISFRTALSMAIDRDRIVADGSRLHWQTQAALIGERLDDLPQPATPEWAALPLDERSRLAAEVVARLRGAGPPPVLRVVLPSGPGADRLFALVAADWRAIGVLSVRIAPGGDGDLRLVDAIAAADTAAWTLRRFTCDLTPACSATADRALAEARTAPSLAERARQFAAADAELAAAAVFIPLARPLRWSLVAPGLRGFAPNRRASHALGAIAGAP